MFIETIIGSAAKVKVLRVLVENKIAYSLYEIKKLSNLSMGVVHKVITSLLKENIITKKKGKGKQGFYQINIENAKEIIALFDKERTQRRGIMVNLWNLLESLCSELTAKTKGIKQIILFGSYARGESRINSDVDLLILTKNDFKDETKARALCKNRKIKINLLFMNEDEFAEHEKKKSDFYQNILKEGLRLI